MPVKVTNNFPKFKTTVEKKAAQFIIAAAGVGAKWSRYWAPIEFSRLVNSQRIDTFAQGTEFIGRVSFDTKYAIFLEKNPKWKPRPVELKKGPAANMRAKPGFLRAGFEDHEPQREIQLLKSKVFKIG